MHSTIKQLLREAFDKLSVGHNPELTEFERKLYDEGKKFFPKLTFKYVTDKYNGKINVRAFRNYSKNKGSFSLETFKNEIINAKIGKTLEWLQSKGIKDLVYSNTTSSIYFTYNGKNIRISNHKKNSFNGIDVLIKWFTTPKEVADQFI